MSVECKACGAWFASTMKTDLCTTCERAMKRLGFGNFSYDRLRELVRADREGRCFITPFVAMVEQSLMNGEMTPEKDQRFNGRYAVVYCKPQRWATPLIDICGTPYNRDEAEKRTQQLIREAAEKALEKEEKRNG